ncbi:unnamed protein product, partial [Ectocarpus sp. 12 AP-2014]
PRRGDSKTSNVQVKRDPNALLTCRLVRPSRPIYCVDTNAAHSWHDDAHRRRSSHFLSLHRSQSWQHAVAAAPHSTSIVAASGSRNTCTPPAHVRADTARHTRLLQIPTPPRNNCQDTRYSNVSSSSHDRS